MNSRWLIIASLLLVLGAGGTWIWLGGGGKNQEIPSAAMDASHADSQRKARSGETHAHQKEHSVLPSTLTPSQLNVPVSLPSQTSSVTAGTPLVRTETTHSNPVATAPSADTDVGAKADLEAVQFMLRDFRTRMSENPVGSNAEIMRAVMGNNPASAKLGPPAGQSLNSEGELIDRWGTPYFFHQLSKHSMEVRSAGPDRTMWTADDLVTK